DMREAGSARARGRNGPLFVVKWDEYRGDNYSVWRGGGDRPFRILRGAPVQNGAPCISPDGRWFAYLDAASAIVVRRIFRSRDRLGRRQVIGQLPVRR